MIYGILLSFAALVIIALIAVLIIFWAVPVTFTGHGELRRDAATLIFAFRLKWGALSIQTQIPEEANIGIILFGRTIKEIPLEIPPSSKKTPKGHEEEKEPATEEPEKKEEKEKPMPDIIGIADAVLSQAGAVLHQISIPYLRTSLRFGLGDAALTGEVFGMLMAIRSMLMATGDRVSLAAEAVFHERVVEGEAEGAICIAHPLGLAPPAIRILRHPSVWKMVRNR